MKATERKVNLLNKPVTVYSYRRCPFAIRVRMTLHEKEIPFHVIEEKIGNFSDELKKLHPQAAVPVLIHGNQVIYESAIITEYLDDAFDGIRLLPEDAALRVKIRLLTYWCNHIFKQDIDFFKYGAKKRSQEEMNQAVLNLKDHLKRLEALLETSAWLVENEITLADIHLFPFYRQLFKCTPPYPHIEEYPKLKKWLEQIVSRPSFEKTMEKQKTDPDANLQGP